MQKAVERLEKTKYWMRGLTGLPSGTPFLGGSEQLERVKSRGAEGELKGQYNFDRH